MARKRDYKAEYARRKARFQANPELKKAYYRRQYENQVRRAIRSGFGSVREMKRTTRSKKYNEALDWSRRRAKTYKAVFNPDNAPNLGVTVEKYTDVYWKAWVHDYDDARYEGGTDALYEWLVELNAFEDNDEYDDKYSTAG